MNNENYINVRKRISLDEVDNNFCGIYHLYFGNKVVYVGQSTNCMYRLYTHRKNEKMVFDSISITPEIPERLTDTEVEHIIKYQPILNKNLPKTEKYSQARSFLYKNKISCSNANIDKITKGISPVFSRKHAGKYYKTEDLIQNLHEI